MSPIFYPASSQNRAPSLTQRYVIRSTEPPTQAIASIGAVLSRIDHAITVRYSTLERQISEAMLREQLMARLSSIFAVIALLLAAVGLYGVVV